MRINKYLADTGITTRRGADALILEGVVFVNGTKAVLGMDVHETDTVEVRKKSTKTYRYLLYYKPRGIITHSPGRGETDIAMQIQKDHRVTGLFPVGRLDKDSNGLILLTDDGRVTKRLLDPERGHEKEYLVVVDKRVTGTFLNALTRGVTIEGYRTLPATALPAPENEHAFHITLTEGKKHQIRRMCAALGYQVLSLTRIRILGFSPGTLQPGAYRPLGTREVERLYRLLHIPPNAR